MKPVTEPILLAAANAFDFGGPVVCDGRHYGEGHINDTYLVWRADHSKRFILQRINTDTFTDPVGLMENICGVTRHLSRKILAEGGDPFDTAAAIAAALPPAENTHGSAVRAQCGGVRQEAVSGFPTARHMRGLLESAGPLSALVWAMSRLDDSTLVYRGGPQGLAYVRRRAAELLRLPEEALPPALEALDDDLMARRLSPGGSADLLALALFLRAAAPETWL